MNLKPMSLTRQLLEFKTVNPPGIERACARYLGGLLESAGYRVSYFEFAEKRTTLVARLSGGSEKKPVCFTGHLDTVPLGATPWSRDPFGSELDGDRLYGRGASDMKSGIAAMTMMALRLAQTKNRKGGVTFVFTAGEETTCQGAEHLTRLDNALGQAGALIAGEPTANAPWVAHKGCVHYEIRTKGTAAHASMPERGDNAIYKAAEVIAKLRQFRFDISDHPILGAPTLSVGTISGGTAINLVPDEAAIGVDFRTLPSQDEETILLQLWSLLGPDVEIRRLDGARSVETNADNEWVQHVFDIIERLHSERPVPGGATYFTDCSVLTPAYGNPPTIILGPGEPEMAHKTDEFCHLSKIEWAIEAYTEIARTWCGV
jgi:succinyl-diaminopimelate desuccinylase